MILSNTYKVISPYMGNGQRDWWRDLNVGDIVKFSVCPTRSVGRNELRTDCLNITTGSRDRITPGSLSTYLNRIELEESKSELQIVDIRHNNQHEEYLHFNNEEEANTFIQQLKLTTTTGREAVILK